MKKLLFALSASALFLAACSVEEAPEEEASDQATVTQEVHPGNTPDESSSTSTPSSPTMVMIEPGAFEGDEFTIELEEEFEMLQSMETVGEQYIFLSSTGDVQVAVLEREDSQTVEEVVDVLFLNEPDLEIVPTEVEGADEALEIKGVRTTGESKYRAVIAGTGDTKIAFIVSTPNAEIWEAKNADKLFESLVVSTD